MSVTHDEFYALVHEFREKQDAILKWKSGEYTNGEDKLLNFKEVAAFLGCSASQVCLEFMLKHVHSVKLAVMGGTAAAKFDWEIEGGEGLKQRLSDIMNYCLLLAACLEEEKNMGREEQKKITRKSVSGGKGDA